MAENQRSSRYAKLEFVGGIDQAESPKRVDPSELTDALNVVYRRGRTVSKRTGSGPYAGNASGFGLPANSSVLSGLRWHRAIGPSGVSPLAQLLVQSSDQLWSGNDLTGNFTSLGSLGTNSQSAYFAGAHDNAESAVAGTPASDIVIVTAGVQAPFKYDGTNFTQLNSSITNKFVGCHSWHNHVFYWGDPNFPDTVFASDLNNPESFAFMNTFGGYPISPGDGDPTVQRVLSVGATNYIFKANSIQQMQGFDFAVGEYQFSLTPFSETVGTFSGRSVARLNDSLIFWSGSNFYMIVGGSMFPIGDKMANSIASAAIGSQSVINAVAGTFFVQTLNGPSVYQDVYLCALDINADGVADTILMYDDYRSRTENRPMWTIWNGLNIGCFIPWRGALDQKALYFGDSKTNYVGQIGQNAFNDNGKSIPCSFTSALYDAGTPMLRKHVDRVYIVADSNDVTFNVRVTAEDQTTQGITQVSQSGIVEAGFFGTAPPAATFGTGPPAGVFGRSGGSQETIFEAKIDPSLTGKSFAFNITEASNTSAWEMTTLEYHFREEAYAHRGGP
jgi:hypothetical protein